ncbi:MAG: hypothetical protein ABI427_07260 [Solirubrobacteraceae bacterium]
MFGGRSSTQPSTAIEPTLSAQVPGLEQAGFAQRERAADLCPVSNVVRGNVDIRLRSELEQ